MSNLPSGFLGLVTAAGAFHLQSAEEYGKMQRHIGGLRDVDFDLIRKQKRGEFYFCGQRATDPLYTYEAQALLSRACLVDAGGETITVD